MLQSGGSIETVGGAPTEALAVHVAPSPSMLIADAPSASRMFWTQPGTTNVQGYLVPTNTVLGTLTYGTGDNRRAAFHKQTRTLVVADIFGSVAFIN